MRKGAASIDEPLAFLKILFYLTLFAILMASGAGASSKKAVMALGCFWKPQHALSSVSGVLDSRVGYCGGTTKSPTYKEVCTGTTGHAESVEVTYNPSELSFEALVKWFFENHDPTTPNCQGPDHGTQYRSAFFYSSEEEKAAIEAGMKEAQKRFLKRIVTEIAPLPTFYPAEDYHQHYLAKRDGRH